MSMMNGSLEGLIYKINDGRMWDTTTAEWITELPEGHDALELWADGKPAGEDYLIKCLEFYKFPLGELIDKSVVGLKRKLAELDEIYLTPRTMAGLATGTDEVAKQSWAEHERLAEPLREKLAVLEPDALKAKMASLTQE